MSTFDTQEVALQLTMATTTLLFFKFFLTVSKQGKVRFAAGSRPPEDDKFKLTDVKNNFDGRDAKRDGEGGPPKEQLAALAEEQRWNRVVMNDLENLPLGLIVAWASYHCCAAQARTTSVFVAHNVMVIFFLVGRVGHTLAYAYALQPWRSLMYMLGLLGVAGMGILGFVSSLMVSA